MIILSSFFSVVPTDPIDRTLNGESFSANKLFFNLGDSMTANGYVRTVTIQYAQGHSPSSTARIWIYAIVPVAGSYSVCSSYPIPTSQISTTQLIQTYMLAANVGSRAI
ncbi:unnamed protein product [Rotaria magnacalcarata]|uniref:Uncharacterized protein n=3 Tax=Rotaria magnacalcarata TaxID=392030 RepID=A0A816Y3H0_9BILA|nr:unnamed protein product [Rotaria magnacalcarata]CAF2154184.1 unnamed protein product [Rotaria magnacalcarata]CAF4504357.1 unnamed protein product [Rotaria magnacalcarata]